MSSNSNDSTESSAQENNENPIIKNEVKKVSFFWRQAHRHRCYSDLFEAGVPPPDSGGAESERRPQGRDGDAARQTSWPSTQISSRRLWDGRKRQRDGRSRPREEKSGRLQRISRLGQQQSVKAKERGGLKETDRLTEVSNNQPRCCRAHIRITDG